MTREQLIVENARLRERVDDLQARLDDYECRPGWLAVQERYRLPRVQAEYLALFLRHGEVSLDILARYGRPDVINTDSVKVSICRLRQAIKPHGMRIESIWGWGFRLVCDPDVMISSMAGDLRTMRDAMRAVQ